MRLNTYNWLAARARRTVNGVEFIGANVVTRQQLRAKDRADAFYELTKMYGGEPRRARRAMSLAIARNAMRKRKALALAKT